MMGVLVGIFQKNPYKVPESRLIFTPKRYKKFFLRNQMFVTIKLFHIIKISGDAYNSSHVLLNTLEAIAITLLVLIYIVAP